MSTQKRPGVGTTLVNAVAATVSPDFSRSLVARPPPPAVAPIDEYYSKTADLLVQSGEPWCTDWHLQLLVVALVSDVELYVRSLLVGLVATCPSAFKTAERKQVSLASISYYSTAERAFAIFDHQALSGAQEICRATLQIVGLEIKPNTSVHAALETFDRLCHIRHSIVHQTGRLAVHNLLEFGLDSMPSSPMVVQLDSIRFQEFVAVCHTAVRAYNQHVFDQTLSRWIRDGVLTMAWGRDKERFGALCGLLQSKTDFPATPIEDIYKSIGGTVE